VVCRVVRLDGPGPDTVVRTPVLWRRKSERSIFAALGISLDGLEPGKYRLVAFADDGAARPGAVQTADFSVVVPEERFGAVEGQTRLVGLSESEARHYRELQFIATPAELAYYNSLSDSGREAYLVRFWKRHDLAEFSRRMDVADSRYSAARVRGAQTDRGRIYITYGEPDAVEQRVMEMESRPREYWHYYGPGYSFIFVDIRADGNYRLVWTNSPHEGPTGLTQYLTPEEQEQFR
jgi:GWxTD domain-containing protein